MSGSWEVASEANPESATNETVGAIHTFTKTCDINPHFQSALTLLLDAHGYAEELGRDAWDFAVEIEVLQRVGLTNSDLRGLIYKGIVEHAREITMASEEERNFRKSCNSSFSQATCFVLTDVGVAFVRSYFGQISSKHKDSWSLQPLQNSQLPTARMPHNALGVSQLRVVYHSDAMAEFQHAHRQGMISEPAPLVPVWDRDRQELRLGKTVIKQFKVPAPNQELVLASFQEDAWPVRIDDPLPPNVEIDPKRRLHDTINSLNRNQKQNLIRFMGDGRGQGVRWGLVRTDS